MLRAWICIRPSVATVSLLPFLRLNIVTMKGVYCMGIVLPLINNFKRKITTLGNYTMLYSISGTVYKPSKKCITKNFYS